MGLARKLHSFDSPKTQHSPILRNSTRRLNVIIRRLHNFNNISINLIILVAATCFEGDGHPQAAITEDGNHSYNTRVL